jgi:hypothetical protein
VSERGNHRIQIFKIIHKPKVEPQTDEELQQLLIKRRQQTQAALAGEEVEWEQFVEFELLFTLGDEGTLNAQFKFPVKMCVKTLSHNTQLWVADSMNDRIQVTIKFSPELSLCCVCSCAWLVAAKRVQYE